MGDRVALDAEDAPPAPCCVVCCGAPHAAESDDDHVVCWCHMPRIVAHPAGRGAGVWRRVTNRSVPTGHGILLTLLVALKGRELLWQLLYANHNLLNPLSSNYRISCLNSARNMM